MNTEEVKVTKSLNDFIPVWKETAKEVWNPVPAAVDELCLHIRNYRGQGYDNGANMKGRVKGVKGASSTVTPETFSLLVTAKN